MGKVVAITGMCGSGKSVVADYLIKKGFGFFRFGQITLDEVARRGLPPTEENERPIREEFRRKHGMAAFAVLNFPTCDALRKKGHVVADGMYSFEEYLAFEERYKGDFVCLAMVASPDVRYSRLAGREWDPAKDPAMRHRPASFGQARSRDIAEIENLRKGGTIAMAHHYIVNEGKTKEQIIKEADLFLKRFRLG
ncbi:AAA family ATPase [Candidatus Woesearchaeota archaeon]|nr:AAA family ATPase [Candidatus Woesearchaeota archaeon]